MFAGHRKQILMMNNKAPIREMARKVNPILHVEALFLSCEAFGLRSSSKFANSPMISAIVWSPLAWLQKSAFLTI